MIVDLNFGPTVTEAALLLVLDLERRGISMRVDDLGKRRFSGRREAFTEADSIGVRAHGKDFAAIVRYCEHPERLTRG